jgi:hypothetical protein
MTKLNTDWYPEVVPGFDALAWKDKVQAEILEETKGMTRQEVREYFRKGSEAFRAEMILLRQGRTEQQMMDNTQ